MFRWIFVIGFSVLFPHLFAQKAKYFLDVNSKIATEKINKAVLLFSVARHNKLVVLSKGHNQIALDSLLDYPQTVQLNFYANCSKKLLDSLSKLGSFKDADAQLSIFIAPQNNKVEVTSSGLHIVKPTYYQQEYERIDSLIGDRVELFYNNPIDKDLKYQIKTATTKNTKDSLRKMDDSLFLVWVGLPNLDSVYKPAIVKNINNPIALYAMDKYIWQAHILNITIPAKEFSAMLNVMPKSQKSSELWNDLRAVMNSEALGNGEDVIKNTSVNGSILGKRAPEFINLKDTSGRILQLKDFKGKIVFLDFWASWCAPCIGQIPQLKNIYNLEQSGAVVFIGVSMDSDANSWKREVKKQHIPWVNISDLKDYRSRTSVDYNIVTVPHNFLIDKNGIIVKENIELNDLPQAIQSLK